MRNNKKLLIYFLALNTIISSYVNAAPTVSLKPERIYGNMKKNIEKGRTNKENYKFIEQILRQKNKELKDLYSQNDYIIKPEYLEWQVYFTGSYEEYGKGRDNTSENAKYHTKVDGYYDTNGNYMVTSGITGGVSGKPYKPPQEPKDINLGVNIPLKGITRDPLSLSLSGVSRPDFTPKFSVPEAPRKEITVNVEVDSFKIDKPLITIPGVPAITPINVVVPDTPNGDDSFNSLGNTTSTDSVSYVGNYNFSEGELSGVWNSQYLASYSYSNLTGTSNWRVGSNSMSGAGSNGPINVTDYKPALYEITGANTVTFGENFKIKITSNLSESYNGMLPHLIQYDPHGTRITYTAYQTDYYGNELTSPLSRWDRYGELVNKGTIEGEGNSLLMIGLQMHEGQFSPTVKNDGLIRGLYIEGAYGSGGEKHVAFSFIAVRSGNADDNRRLEFYNRRTGIIEMQAKNSIALNYSNKGIGRLSVYNDGKIVLYGNGSYGIKTSQSGADLSLSKIVLRTPVTINGDSSIGVELARVMDDGYNTAGNPNPLADGYDKQAAEIRVTIGDEPNRYAGNAAGNSSTNGNPYDKNYVEDSIGLYVNHQSLDYRLKEYEFLFGEFAKNSVLVYINQGILTLDNIKYDSINIDKGSNNVGLVVDGSKGTKSELNLYPHIKVGETGAVDGTTALIAKAGGKINLLGSNNIETNGKQSHGIVLTGTNTILTGTTGGEHRIKTTGDNSASVYVDGGTFNLGSSENVDIYATGNKSVGVYNIGGTVNLGRTGGTYTVGTNGVIFYNNGGTINTAGRNFTVGNSSIFSMIDNSGRINFNSPSTLNLLSGSTGFIVDGIPSTYFNTHYSGLNKMDVVLTQGSTLVALRNANSSLSSLSFDTLTQNFKTVTLNGGDIASLLEGTLTLDQNVSLDNPIDSYNLIKKSLIGVIIDPAITVSGSNDNQVALAGNFSSVTGVAYNNMINNGTINLTGENSVAIYANNGNIINNNNIFATGKNSFGMYSENGTTAQNSANITIGDQGIGIYGVSHQNPANTGTHGYGKINIINSGNITSSGGSGSIGIYSNLNKTSGLKNEARINLSGGTINLGNVTKAVGVYVNKGEVTDSGSTITVGKDGIGIYAKDSDLTLNNTNINLHGDNALGLYLEGDTNLLAGNGNINVQGQNVVLFNIVTNANTTINNNFNVTSSAGSTYTIGNITNGEFKYTGTSSLSSNGTFVAGKNSTVLLDTSAEINVNPGSTGVAAIALDGQRNSVPSGMRAGFDGENKGRINLENSSVGLYGKNGSRLSNLGTINVGSNSAALVSSGSGAKLDNGGSITIGANSQGMYLNGGNSVNNSASGRITASSNNSVGIFAENVPVIDNYGNISLTGDKSIGIYSKGISAISNYGTIEIGNSNDMNNPSIGIYSDNTGHTITNTGTVKSGINSIGIYSNGGTVHQNGNLDTGNNGVGIYAVNSSVFLNSGSRFDMGVNGITGAVGVYGIGALVTNSANINIGNSNYGFIMKNGSFTNNTGTSSVIGMNSVFLYSTEATMINNAGNLTMTGSDNVGYYTAKDTLSGTGGASVTNTGNITGISGNNNVGIYNYGGLVNNYGTVSVGGSDLKFKTNAAGTLELDVENSKYAVGIYGENSNIVNYFGATISAGRGGFGVVAKGGTAVNFGTITTNGDYSTGMYTEGGVITNESGAIINVAGNSAIGMAGKGENSHIINKGTINITGDNAIGMYGNLGTVITNTGTINITGNGQAFVSSDPKNPAHNIGSGESSINGVKDNEIKSAGSTHTLPTLINAGIIKTTGVLALDGMQVLIKPDPATKKPSSNPDYDFELSGTSLIAGHITTSKPIVILPGFADGTIANVYKLENVIKAKSGKYDFISGSLLWTATPKATDTGSDVYMSRKAFTEFSDGLWFDDFGKSLEKNYLKAKGDGVKIYNKTGYIKTEEQFRYLIGSMAGNVYSNINQRENDISRTFENSLDFIEGLENNTKENVKINVIAGKGKNKEETDGVVGYDYTTTGVLALREIERTYKHKFGYSLGYLHTGFEFKDGNESEEWVDTIHLGIHNKYKSNNWILKNDLMGRVSIHNIDRNIDWPSPLKRSEMNGTYETYSFTSDNKLGREFELGKRLSITPYTGLRAMYVIRPTFKESGLEKLEIEGNDGWSVKPKTGVELQTTLPLGSTAWQLKGTLDFAYEYELADLNKREKAKLISVEDNYHKLSKPEDEKGIFRTKASVGVEVKDRYGLFLTGEYLKGEDKEEDYRTGVTLKAVF